MKIPWILKRQQTEELDNLNSWNTINNVEEPNCRKFTISFCELVQTVVVHIPPLALLLSLQPAAKSQHHSLLQHYFSYCFVNRKRSNFQKPTQFNQQKILFFSFVRSVYPETEQLRLIIKEMIWKWKRMADGCKWYAVKHKVGAFRLWWCEIFQASDGGSFIFIRMCDIDT